MGVRAAGRIARGHGAFEKYATAVQGLLKPSSAARALAAGATDIERIDLLVKLVAEQQGLQSDSVDETVRLVCGWLTHNRKQAAQASRSQSSATALNGSTGKEQLHGSVARPCLE